MTHPFLTLQLSLNVINNVNTTNNNINNNNIRPNPFLDLNNTSSALTYSNKDDIQNPVEHNALYARMTEKDREDLERAIEDSQKSDQEEEQKKKQFKPLNNTTAKTGSKRLAENNDAADKVPSKNKKKKEK